MCKAITDLIQDGRDEGKMENDPNNPEFIKTVWGTGYILEI